jgi:hypothetical protein
MKVLYERVAGPASISMPPPWPLDHQPGPAGADAGGGGRGAGGEGRNETGVPRGFGGVCRRTVDNGAGAGVVAGTVGIRVLTDP